MVKSVYLETGLSFATITSARQHFVSMLNRNEIKEPFFEDDLVEITALYLDYCAKANWPLSSPPISFYPTYVRGKGYTSRCFGITFADGLTAHFSLDLALKTVAV